jgi:hypothetical protein
MDIAAKIPNVLQNQTSFWYVTLLQIRPSWSKTSSVVRESMVASCDRLHLIQELGTLLSGRFFVLLAHQTEILESFVYGHSS